MTLRLGLTKSKVKDDETVKRCAENESMKQP